MKKAKTIGSFGAIFGVAAVLFGSHAGGGFATGNQETQYYVQFGWTAPITAILAMVLLTVTLREAIVMTITTTVRIIRNYLSIFGTHIQS